jgi:hypothetical protein
LKLLGVVVEVKLVVVREARELRDVVFVHFAEYTCGGEWHELREFRERWEPALWVTLRAETPKAPEAPETDTWLN